MAWPFWGDVLDEEALILRWTFRHGGVFWDRSDPLVLGDDYLIERYRLSGDGLRYLYRLLGPKIQNQTAQSHAFTVPQMVCVTLRFFASGSFLYSVGVAENLNTGTICRTIRRVCLALKSFISIFITTPGNRRPLYIKEEFYKIASNLTFNVQPLVTNMISHSWILTIFCCDSPCRPPNPTTAGLQPCTQQDKGLNRDDLWPSDISVSVPTPPEGLFGSHFSWLLGSWNGESKSNKVTQ